MFTSGRRSASFFASVLIGALPLAGCDDGPPARPIVPTDMSVADFGTDAGLDGGVDLGTDLGIDAGVDGGSGLSSCNAGTATRLLESTYLVGGAIPFGAEANVGGLLVASSVQTATGYPFIEDLGVIFAPDGIVSPPAVLVESVTAMSTQMAIARVGTGYLTVFDDVPGSGPTDLFSRVVSATGQVAGSGPTNVTSTASVGEISATALSVPTGVIVGFNQVGVGAHVTTLDATGALAGPIRDVTGTVGTTATARPFATGGNPRIAFLGSNSHVQSVALAADAMPSGTPTELSVLTSSSKFAVVGAPQGAGLVYESTGAGGRTGITFRYVNDDGSATVAERTLTDAISRGYDPSIAPIAGGWLVLFRYVPDSGTSTLRLVLLRTFGDTVHTLDLVDSYEANLRYAVRVSPDGVPYVVYQRPATIVVPGPTSLPGGAVFAARLTCQ